MPLLETFIFTIGPIVGKALLKNLLDDHPVLKDIAPDLLDYLRDQAKAERGAREASQQTTKLGETIAATMRPLFNEARLGDGELAAVVRELLLTLNQADIGAEQLVESRMDVRHILNLLTAARPEATTTLSAAGGGCVPTAVEHGIGSDSQ